jgi:hypothetical protein
MKRIAILSVFLLAGVSTIFSAEEKIVSPTLKLLLMVEIDELMSKQKFQPGTSLEKVREDVAGHFEKYLRVTAADEERLKKGEVDDAQNRKRMNSQYTVMEFLSVDRPAFTRKFAGEWQAGKLSGMRLELALRVNMLFFEKMAETLKMPRFANPESLVLSDTLLREMTIFVEELLNFAMAQGEKAPKDVNVEEWKRASLKPLVYLLFVTPEEEAQFRRGQFDDGANKAKLTEQNETFEKAIKMGAEIPDFNKKGIAEFKSGKMSRVRMELAVRLNESSFERAKSAMAAAK